MLLMIKSFREVQTMMIVLEGIDNCGKTTISEMLAKYYSKKGSTVLVSKELTTYVGTLIEEKFKSDSISPVVKTFLFAADRQIRLEAIAKSAQQYAVLIMDRYLYSAIVYREAEGIDGQWVNVVNKFIPEFDIGFYIDITPEESIRRNTETKFNIHYSIAHLARVRDSYLQKVNNTKLVKVNSMRSIDMYIPKLLMC